MSTPRSVVLERLTYVLAAPVIAAAPNFSPDGLVSTSVLLTGGACAAGGVLAVKKSSEAGRKLVRFAPPVLAAAIDVAAKVTPGWGPWALDAVLAAGWAAAGWMVLPYSRTARRRHRPALAAPAAPALPTASAPAADADLSADPFTRKVRQLWERAGNPGRTHVVKATPHPAMPHDLTLLLHSAEDGRPITGLSEAAVAAAFGIDETDVKLRPVAQQNGRQSGPGWMEADLTPDDNRRRRTQPSDQERWRDSFGSEGGPIPGSKYLGKVRNNQRGVTYWQARLPETLGDPKIDMLALCKQLDAGYDEGRVFVTIDDQDILISVWDTSPLATVYPATRELLTPDAEGRWVAGYLGNGQPARNRVFTDRGAAHGLYVAPSGGGKTQLMALAIAADANFGSVVWLATEAPDEKTAALGKHTDRQGVGALYMLRVLRAALALMEIRAEMVWADGQLHDWSPYAPGCPYSPLSLYLDEFLSGARHEVYGVEIMDLAEQVSVKGRKYGIGEKIAGQSVYVQDGFTQLLCENLRENGIPIVLKVAPKKMGEMFKTLAVAQETSPTRCPAPSPRRRRAASRG